MLRTDHERSTPKEDPVCQGRSYSSVHRTILPYRDRERVRQLPCTTGTGRAPRRAPASNMIAPVGSKALTPKSIQL